MIMRSHGTGTLIPLSLSKPPDGLWSPALQLVGWVGWTDVGGIGSGIYICPCDPPTLSCSLLHALNGPVIPPDILFLPIHKTPPAPDHLVQCSTFKTAALLRCCYCFAAVAWNGCACCQEAICNSGVHEAS